jgi:putative tricarboxylic transport membrane protein
MQVRCEMDLFFTALANAAYLATDPWMIGFVFFGVLWGCAFGALPGLNSVVAIGVMVPFTFTMGPVHAVAFLISISVGNAFGNSIPAILIGVPGTGSAIITALEGYALHRKGQSGLALGVTYFASVTGQGLATLLFLFLVIPLGGLAYVFIAPEQFALFLLGSTALIMLSGSNIWKGMAAAALGLTLAMVGRDPLSAVSRFTFGVPELRAGLQPIPVVLGFLAVSEIYRSMRQAFTWDKLSADFSPKFPPLSVFRRVTPPVLVGTAMGSVIGAIPGVAGSVSAIASYQQSKIWSRHPEEYGHGSVDGIAANEAAQNADQAGELIPTFGLGIPASGAMVVLLGALLTHGFVPGPLMIKEAPQLLYAAVAGLLLATAMLGLVGWWIARGLLKVVTFDRSLLLSGALFTCMIGVFSVNNTIFDVWIMLFFGVIGYFMLRYGFPTAGASIAFILGTGLEINLRSGLMLKQGDVLAFVSRPYTAIILCFSLVLLVFAIRSTIKLGRKEKLAREMALRRHLDGTNDVSSRLAT